ncbi:hypothetical protein [Bordetella bronchiseptica]|uniref:hypothetical protein n=1 Tax=Bordetella bronchiseptica TaxID=518 RepID=UPI001268B99A|nr:hypothetical protein [Bordetella bronchiseptica]
MALHLSGTEAERTACGMAFDAFDSGDADEPVEFAQPGQVATCPECRAVVDYFHSIKKYREPRK